MVWHLRRTPPAKLKNILTIVINEGKRSSSRILPSWRKCMHVFIAMQDSHKLAAFNGMPKGVRKGKVKGWKHRRQLSRRILSKTLHFPRIALVA